MRVNRVRQVAKELCVMGIDPSLTSTGWACRGEVGRLRSKFKGGQRYEHLRNQFIGLLEHYRPDVIFYEGYAFGMKPQQGTMDRAEVAGLFKLETYLRGIPIVLVPPKTLKKVATNNGNSGKPAMKSSIVSLFNVDSSCNHDEIDAYALCAMGESLLLGRGPAGFLNRARAARDAIAVVSGKGKSEVQTIAHLASVG